MFKVGDKIKCNGNFDGSFTKNKIYEVIKLHDNKHPYIIKDSGEEDWYNAIYFDLVKLEYKVGDKVVISEKIRGKKWLGGIMIIEQMVNYIGEVLIIDRIETKTVCGIEYYLNKLEEYAWSKEMFDKYEETDKRVTYDEYFNKEDKKMEEPKTKLEKTACKQAKEDAIDKAIANKKKVYTLNMDSLISMKNLILRNEKDLKELNKDYKELATKLNVTKADEEQLF